MHSNGLATVLLMIPVLAVPALAIFGIPQFAPVVASPLDEDRDDAKESRVGHSSRASEDEFLGEFDGFGAESRTRDESRTIRADSSSNRTANARLATQRGKAVGKQTWGDSLDSEWPTKPNRKLSNSESNEFDSSETQVTQPSSRSFESRDEPAAKNPRRSQFQRNDESIRLASAVDVDDAPAEVSVDEANSGRLSHSRGKLAENTSDPTLTRNPRRLSTSAESLTWQSAVERLNQLEIRNFRLEPGHQSGQFVFICSYTPPNTPRVSYRFEAGADEPLKAVEKVLEQIIDWQHRR